MIRAISTLTVAEDPAEKKRSFPLGVSPGSPPKVIELKWRTDVTSTVARMQIAPAALSDEQLVNETGEDDPSIVTDDDGELISRTSAPPAY